MRRPAHRLRQEAARESWWRPLCSSSPSRVNSAAPVCRPVSSHCRASASIRSALSGGRLSAPLCSRSASAGQIPEKLPQRAGIFTKPSLSGVMREPKLSRHSFQTRAGGVQANPGGKGGGAGLRAMPSPAGVNLDGIEPQRVPVQRAQDEESGLLPFGGPPSPRSARARPQPPAPPCGNAPPAQGGEALHPTAAGGTSGSHGQTTARRRSAAKKQRDAIRLRAVRQMGRRSRSRREKNPCTAAPAAEASHGSREPVTAARLSPDEDKRRPRGPAVPQLDQNAVQPRHCSLKLPRGRLERARHTAAGRIVDGGPCRRPGIEPVLPRLPEVVDAPLVAAGGGVKFRSPSSVSLRGGQGRYSLPE